MALIASSKRVTQFSGVDLTYFPEPITVSYP